MVLQPQGSAQQQKPVAQSPRQVAESVPAYKKSPASRTIPHPKSEPPPPDDPPNWEDFSAESPGFSSPEAIVVEPESPAEEPHPEPVAVPVLPPVEEIPAPPVPALLRPTMNPPTRVEEDQAPQMLTVILRPTGDGERDIRRISRLYGTLISFPGKDRFAFQIFEEGRGHLIEFPNDTTHLCTEMLAKIKDAVGEENMRMEPILYQ
jgi:DNA polymerase-3 subunit alpha